MHSRSRCVFVPRRSTSLYLLFHHLRRKDFPPIPALSIPRPPPRVHCFNFYTSLSFHYIYSYVYFTQYTSSMFYRHCNVLSIDKLYFINTYKFVFPNPPPIYSTFFLNLLFIPGTRLRSCLRHCATSRKVAGSIPDGVIGIFNSHNPSGRTMVLVLTQPPTEMSTRSISWG